MRSCGEDLAEGGVEEVGGAGSGGDEAGFQGVAPAHQLVHLRHDALLFGMLFHVGFRIFSTQSKCR